MTFRRTTRLAVASTTAALTIATGCKLAPPAWSGDPSPFGSLDSAALTGTHTVTFTGWADESDTTEPVAVFAYVFNSLIGGTHATGARPDVAAVFPQSSSAGYAITVTNERLLPGALVCVSALNRGAGDNTVLGCTRLTEAPAPVATPPTVPPTTVPETTTSTTAPPDPLGAVAIDAGGAHSVALLRNGTIRAWGENVYGQLGNSTYTSSSAPVTVFNISTATAIATGDTHTVALLANGMVRAWGSDYYGQLGNVVTADSANPVVVQGPTNVTAIAAGEGHTLALQANGVIKAWGLNGAGQIGNGSNGMEATAFTPVDVEELDEIVGAKAVDVAAGDEHSVALFDDGTIRTWGKNSSGQLGNGTTTNSPLPVKVSGIENAVAIAAGGDHSLAVLEDGTVVAWGDNSHGQLGNDDGAASTPQAVTGLADVAGINAGAQYSVALLANGTVRSWGNNLLGQLGNNDSGPTAHSFTPVAPIGVGSALAVTAGREHTVALLGNGQLRSWGRNDRGQLGIPGPGFSHVPVAVSGFGG